MSQTSHDFYHLSDYHSLAKLRGEGTPLLLVYSDDTCLILLPVILRNIADVPGLDRATERDITSVYGYAGPTTNLDEVPTKSIARFRSRVVDFLEEMNVCSLFSRLHPVLDQRRLVSGLGELFQMGQTISMDLRASPEAQWAAYRKGHKYDIKKLKKSGFVCVRDDRLEFLDDFVEIYNETMDRRNAAEHLYFDREYFELFFRMKNVESKLIVCLHGSTVTSAAIFVHCSGILQYHLSGSRKEWSKNSPTKLIIDEARIWGNEIEADVFHLGGGAGSKEDSLFAFKAGFSKIRHQFMTWRWIVDQEAYDRLVGMRCLGPELARNEIEKSEFFPKYRSPSLDV